MLPDSIRPDLVCQALEKAGAPGIIMCRVDNNTFATKATTPKGHLVFLHRLPPGTKAIPEEVAKNFEAEGYRFYYNPPALDTIAEEYDWELFDRSRIKSIWAFDPDSIQEGVLVSYDVALEGNGQFGVSDDANMETEFTGKHWFMVYRDDVTVQGGTVHTNG